MTKKVKKINKDITRSRSFRDLVFYIKITKVIVVFFPLMLIAQDSLLSQNNKLSKREKWKILRQKTERDVDKGEISREDADKKYSRFRSHLLGKKAEKKDPVLENHFKKCIVFRLSEGIFNFLTTFFSKYCLFLLFSNSSQTIPIFFDFPNGTST